MSLSNTFAKEVVNVSKLSHLTDKELARELSRRWRLIAEARLRERQKQNRPWKEEEQTRIKSRPAVAG